MQTDSGKTLSTAAKVYGVDVDTVALNVKQEFVAKEKDRNKKHATKPVAKSARAA
jgi:hypothetical protein